MFIIQDEKGHFWNGMDLVTKADCWDEKRAAIFLDEPIYVPEGGIVREVWFTDEHPKMNADFVSEWDGGATLTTRCRWDPVIERVLNQETVDLAGVGNPVRQYVIYGDETFEIEVE